MKGLKLIAIVMISSVLLVACGSNNSNNDEQKNNDHSQKDDKKTSTNKNKNVSSDENSQQNTQQEPISIEKAKDIAMDYFKKDNQNFFQRNQLEYNQDKSSNDEIFIETPMYGENQSTKGYVKINRYTGEILDSKILGAYPDMVGPRDGYIPPKVYNAAVDFYNTFVSQGENDKFTHSQTKVTEEEYSKVMKPIGEYQEQYMTAAQREAEPDEDAIEEDSSENQDSQSDKDDNKDNDTKSEQSDSQEEDDEKEESKMNKDKPSNHSDKNHEDSNEQEDKSEDESNESNQSVQEEDNRLEDDEYNEEK
ncbi:hypothetical protein [Staphylococcus pettenkoferi]|uniref:hypothetical protein n=1 Tax=Staphylococcus pettenkoferi TaxID=170573 RepID=UPI00227262A7|nr:hypothetical protein [Staphylococcus pettenkoferi]MCY1573103.1 hypothetical protein [Staphylococcus pettenkoferi]MCY1579265.1 hypothetical protein [Staphylococcus pettenkoferi]